MATTITSKIKTMFPGNLLRYIAAICDTKRIESNNKKMIVLGDLLYSNGIKFEILGGATNRIALQIDGYAVKFAMDEQGYQDNLIEYALSAELQPYVTKSYETNGYIQVQECVEVMTKESFQLYKVEIYKILDSLCQDYLLGDVGYINKNRTNWGIRNRKPVILDYAYCHRATENLFTCDRCGSALRYDSTYDKLICSDRSACKAVYTYNERKRVQGKQVDIDMINEREAESVKLVGDEVSKDIAMVEDRLIGDNYVIIDNPGDMHRYNKMKEEAIMKVSINGGEEEMTTLEERFEAMVKLAKNPEDAESKKVIMSSISEEIPEPIYTENYQENYMNGDIGIRMFGQFGHEDDEEYDNDEDDDNDSDEDTESMFSQMIQKVKSEKQALVDQYEESAKEEIENYLNSKKEQEKPKESAVVVNDKPVEVDVVVKTEKSVEATVETVKEEPEKVEVKVETKEPEYTESELEEATILVNGKPLHLNEEVTI